MKKKKESIWELIKRLDEQAGQFNIHLHKANHYFDTAASKTAQVLYEHEKQLHRTISKVKKAIKIFKKKNKKKGGS